jgi:hypothetical protein
MVAPQARGEEARNVYRKEWFDSWGRGAKNGNVDFGEAPVKLFNGIPRVVRRDHERLKKDGAADGYQAYPIYVSTDTRTVIGVRTRHQS